MSDTRIVTAAFLRRVTAYTKHGPGGRGANGPCDEQCPKCEAEALLKAPPPAPVCHDRPHGPYDLLCPICDADLL